MTVHVSGHDCVLADGVKETTQTTGTGTYELDGALAGSVSFVTGVGGGNKTLYRAQSGTSWEIGVGTVASGAPPTLARTEILKSSNNDNAVNWTGGTIDIFVTAPAALLDQITPATLPGTAGDGSTNDRDALQTLIDALPSGGILDLLGTTYRVDSTLDLKADMTLRNGTLDFSNAADGDVLLSLIGSQGSIVALTANAAEGGTTVTVGSVSGFAAGDYVLIGSEQAYDASDTASWRGEINIVSSAVSTTITLTIPLQQAYTTATSASVRKLTQATNVRIENLECIGKSTNDNNQRAIDVQFGRFIDIQGCRFIGFSDASVRLFQTVESAVNYCRFRTQHDSTLAYGITFVNGTQDCIASNNHFQDVRHSLSTNNVSSTFGIPRRIKFIGNNVIDSAPAVGGSGGDAIDTHAAAEDIEIISNTVHASSGVGIHVGCSRAVILGNEITNTASYGIYYNNETDRAGEIIIANNRIRGAGDMGIRVTQGVAGTTANLQSVVISGNLISGAGGHGVFVKTEGVQDNFNIAISGNSIHAPGGDGIHVTFLLGATIVGNTIRSPSGSAIEVNECHRVAVAGNTVLSDAAAPLILFAAPSSSQNSNSSITGNVIGPTTGTTAEFGIQLVNNVNNVAVVGNVVIATAGISSGSGTGHVVASNVA